MRLFVTALAAALSAMPATISTKAMAAPGAKAATVDLAAKKKAMKKKAKVEYMRAVPSAPPKKKK